jgi:hypothetical protein
MYLARAALVCSLLWQSTAHAIDTRPSAHLIYSVSDATSACPSQEELESAIAARLGYFPFRPDDATRLTIDITRDGSSYRARIELTRPGEDGALRELRSETGDCEELGRSLALAASVAIDPMSLTRAPGVPPAPEVETVQPQKDPPSPEPDPESGPEQQEPPPHRPEREAPPGKPVTWFVRGTGRVSLGLTPELGRGAALAVGARTGRLQLALEPSWDMPTRTSRSGGGTVAGQAWLFNVEMCGLAAWLRYCGVGAAGGYGGRGFDLENTNAKTTFYGAVGPRVMGVFPREAAFQLLLGGTALIALTPTELRLDGREVFTSAPVAALLHLGAEYGFF